MPEERKIEKAMTKEWLKAGKDKVCGRLFQLVEVGTLSLGEALGEAYYEGLCARAPIGKVISFDPTNRHHPCPFERHTGGAWSTVFCDLEDGHGCARDDCRLKKLGGSVLVKVEGC